MNPDNMSTEKILRAKSAAKKMRLCDINFDDPYDLGINPVTGDKMGTKYSGLCMHPGCYKVVPHGMLNVCGKDHGGGDHGCGKYFCGEHLLYQGICWNCFKFGVRHVHQLTQRIQKAKCED